MTEVREQSKKDVAEIDKEGEWGIPFAAGLVAACIPVGLGEMALLLSGSMAVFAVIIACCAVALAIFTFIKWGAELGTAFYVAYAGSFALLAFALYVGLAVINGPR